MINDLKQAVEQQMIAIIDTRRRFVAQIVMDDPQYDPQAHARFLLNHHVTVEDVEHEMVLCGQMRDAMEYEQSISKHEAEIEEAVKELELVAVSNAEIEVAMIKTKDETELKKLRGQLSGNQWVSQKATQRLDTAKNFLSTARMELERLSNLEDPLSTNQAPGNYLLTPRPKRFNQNGHEIPPFGTGLCSKSAGQIHTAAGIRYRF